MLEPRLALRLESRLSGDDREQGRRDAQSKQTRRREVYGRRSGMEEEPDLWTNHIGPTLDGVTRSEEGHPAG